MTEAFKLLQRTEERCYEAEVYRIKGELLLKALDVVKSGKYWMFADLDTAGCTSV